MALPSSRDHDISLKTAAEFTRRYRERAGAGAYHAGMFPRAVYEKILAQAGCAGIRAYRGLHEDGSPATVLVGVDKDGNDMTTGVLAEEDFPCPPYCDPPSPLNS
jgi:hypothetical protein